MINLERQHHPEDRQYKLGHWKAVPPGHRGRLLLPGGARGRGVPGDGVLRPPADPALARRRQVTTSKTLHEATRSRVHFGTEDLFNHKGWERIVRTTAASCRCASRRCPRARPCPVRQRPDDGREHRPECFWLTNALESCSCTSGTRPRSPRCRARSSRCSSGYLDRRPTARRAAVHAARLRLPRRVLARVGGHRRRGAPGQLPGHGHAPGDGVGDGEYEPTWRPRVLGPGHRALGHDRARPRGRVRHRARR
jgi:hypothetical protein